MKTLIGMVLFLTPVLPVHAALLLPDATWDSGGALAPADNQDAPAALSRTLFNLAADARRHARLAEAETLYKQAIALHETARPLAGLALVYLSEGRLALTVNTAERAVRVSAGEPDDILQAAEAKNVLATVLMARGDAAQAEAIEQKVISGLKTAGVTGSQEYVDAITNLGTARLRLGNYAQAGVDLREAEAAALQVAGPRDPSTATVWNNLAKTHAAQGDWKGAEKLYLQAIAAWRASFGPDHPDVASGLSNLATLYEKRKRYSAADSLFRQALAIDTAALGADSLKAANDWNNLGGLFAAEHRLSDAENAIAKGLALAAKAAGFEHPDTANHAVNLAVVEYAQGKYEEASNLFAKALPVEKQFLGPDSVELSSILRIYALTLKAEHDYLAAERAELQATAIVTRNAVHRSL